VSKLATQGGAYVVKEGKLMLGCCCGGGCVDDGLLYRLLIPCSHGISCENGLPVALPCLRILADSLPPGSVGAVYQLLGVCYRYGPIGTDCQLAAVGCPSGAGYRRITITPDTALVFIAGGCFDPTCAPRRVGAVAIECSTGQIASIFPGCGPCVVSGCLVHNALAASFPAGQTPAPTPADLGQRCCDCSPCQGGMQDLDSRTPGTNQRYCCCGRLGNEGATGAPYQASGTRIFRGYSGGVLSVINTATITESNDGLTTRVRTTALTIALPSGDILEDTDNTFDNENQVFTGCSQQPPLLGELFQHLIETGGNWYRGRTCHSWQDSGYWESARDGAGGYFSIQIEGSHISQPILTGCNRGCGSLGNESANFDPFALIP